MTNGCEAKGGKRWLVSREKYSFMWGWNLVQHIQVAKLSEYVKQQISAVITAVISLRIPSKPFST